MKLIFFPTVFSFVCIDDPIVKLMSESFYTSLISYVDFIWKISIYELIIQNIIERS